MASGSVPTSASGYSTVTTENTASLPSFLSTITGSTTGSSIITTTKRCEEMQAVDDNVSKNIIVQPYPLATGENVEFQVRSTKGVSFPDNDTKPTIIVKFGQPADIQSVSIPRDKTSGANVLQFEVIFYSADNKKINEIPVESNLSPEEDNTKPAQLHSTQIPSNTQVSRVDIIVLATINDESPKGVVLDIKACTQATSG